jgi:hypothetical protein
MEQEWKMKYKKILTFTKFFFISLYGAIGVALIPTFLLGILGALSYFLNKCFSFSTCYSEPLIETLLAPKTWKPMLILWILGIVGVWAFHKINAKSN